MKLSKRAKLTIKVMTVTERKALAKAARLLFDNDCITGARMQAIFRTVESKMNYRC